jgi:aldehyde:ferredoxin oxidoreductase
MDSLILCKFLRGVFTDFYAEAAAMLEKVAGWNVTADELRETARRIVATKRQVNVLAGWTPEEDTLPARFLNTPLPNDPAAVLSRERLHELVGEYHRQRGWDSGDDAASSALDAGELRPGGESANAASADLKA